MGYIHFQSPVPVVSYRDTFVDVFGEGCAGFVGGREGAFWGQEGKDQPW